MEKKLFEAVDCNVELPTKSGKYGIVDGDGVDSYYFHLHNIKSEKWTSDENGKHLEFPEYWLCEIPANEPHYRVIKGDEVNSIHGAAMRELNQEQLIALRDKLIRRTPPILPAPLSDADMVEFAEWLGLNEYDFIQGCWYYLGHTTNLTTTELLNKFKNRNK